MNISAIKTFRQGGVHPPDFKLSHSPAIRGLKLPETVAIHLSQHAGAPAAVIVKPGDKVKAGQLIARAEGFISANVHSSVSGTVQKIDDVPDQTGYNKTAVIIKVEDDEWEAGIDLSPEIKSDIKLNAEEIYQRVLAAGIVGMGGAGFPAHVKLKVPEGKKIEYLLINGVECEPFLTSDHRLMLEKGREIIIGVQIILKALGIEQALIGIENNKKDSIGHLAKLAQSDPRIEIHPLKVRYPQGGERQLVKALVNREIPPAPKGLPVDAGCAVFNVATVFAIYEAVQKNKPCVERVVTLTGPQVKDPGNFRVRLGTSVAFLIAAGGGLPESTGKVVSGGPMMGKALCRTDIPIMKTMGGIVILPEEQALRQISSECIRCAKCVSVCPLGLEPYLLMSLTGRADFDRAEEERILSCCECACCHYICPANRPLLDYIRLGKNIVTKIVRSRKTK